jgi:hypothetical protein
MAVGGGILASRARIQRPLGQILPIGAQICGVVVGVACGSVVVRWRGRWCSGYAAAMREPRGLLRWPSCSSSRGQPWQTR